MNQKAEEMKKLNQQRMDEAVQRVVDALGKGELPVWAVAKFRMPEGTVLPPCFNYSFLNRLIVAASGSSDVRGYQAWIDAGRHVLKGARAVWIWSPVIANVKVEEVAFDAATGKDETKIKTVKKLIGFRMIPVFRVEETEGKALPEIPAHPEVPNLPLLEVALGWGIKVRAEWAKGSCGGWFSMMNREIVLCSPEAETFFHELMHAAHGKVLADQQKELKGGQDEEQEIIAELGAACLANLFSMKWNPDNIASYIKGYNGNKNKVVHLFSLVDKCIQKIMDQADVSRKDVERIQGKHNEPFSFDKK